MTGVFDEFNTTTGQTIPSPANTTIQRVKLTCDPPSSPPPGAQTGARKTFR
jgi:hypothetical protein